MHAYKEQYEKIAIPALKAVKEYASPYLIPKVTKVVLNVGLGDTIQAGKNVEEVVEFLSKIAGQKAVITKARKSIAGFKIRQGMAVGVRVTLRGHQMNDFLIKLTQIVLPRTRDFRGIKPSSISADGSLHLGIKDSIVFPEVAMGTFQHPLQATLSVSPACSREEAEALFKSIGFVFSN